MIAASLFGVLLLARILILAGREIPVSVWSPAAYLWQDVLFVLFFAGLEHCFRRSRFAWIVYGSIVIYVALNVPLTRVLSSPLTWPMIRAARGTLSDSIKYHLTLENLSLSALVAATGLILPLLFKRLKLRAGDAAIAAAVILAASGPFASSRIETAGLHRNILAATISTALPRLSARPSAEDWRASPIPRPSLEDLARYRGAVAGRNVILIALESAGAGYLRPYGAAEDPMPNLTRLARDGILFDNAYAVYPESIKGLFSVLRSRYPALDAPPETYSEVDSPGLAQLLSGLGYRTALFHSGRFMYLGMASLLRNSGFETQEDAGAIGGNVNSSFGVDEPSAVARILHWIDSLPRAERFFVTYLPIAGHHPYATPEPGPFPTNDETDRYRNALHYGDAALGELLEGLRTRGLYEKSMLVIYGDHGEAFGQHEGNYGHTLFIYEENVRVPYLIVLPGILQEGIRVKRAASLIDTAPTLLDLLGHPLPAQFQGESLLEGRNRMALFFTDYSLGLLGLRDGCWKYIYELDSGRSKLFDLCRDAAERNDLSARLAASAETYRRRLLDWAAAQKALIVRR